MLQLAAYPQMVLWYLVLLWVPVGLWRGWRAHRAATVLNWTYVLLITSIVALASGNIGTAFRHRDMVIPFYLMFGVAGFLPYVFRRPGIDDRAT